MYLPQVNIIAKTKRTSLHLLSIAFSAWQYFGMEVRCILQMFIEITVSRGYNFYINDVANITLAEQIKICLWRVQNNVESQLRRKLCAVSKPTTLSERHQGILLNLKCANRFCDLITKYSVLFFSTILTKC